MAGLLDWMMGGSADAAPQSGLLPPSQDPYASLPGQSLTNPTPGVAYPGNFHDGSGHAYPGLDPHMLELLRRYMIFASAPGAGGASAPGLLAGPSAPTQG